MHIESFFTRPRLYCSLMLAVFAVLCFQACRKCEAGCDTVFTVNGGALSFSDTIVALSRASAVTTISIEPIVSKRKTDRNCKYENEVSCMEDGLDIHDLSMYCNKELVLGGKSYPMNTDLLQVPELVRDATTGNTSKLPYVLLQTGPDFPKGRYHFLLQGKTKEGKEVEDIGVISWE
ncbi:MAG TPA: hypothetical protein VL092_07415 [Chitinophagaceae bacterium]|nr:hypothetical protein [Chitinophagaceae bacterium]